MIVCIVCGFFFFIISFFLLSLTTFAAAREDKMFSENEIRNILFQVLSGLAFVHKHGKRLLLSFAFPLHFRKGLSVLYQVKTSFFQRCFNSVFQIFKKKMKLRYS